MNDYSRARLHLLLRSSRRVRRRLDSKLLYRQSQVIDAIKIQIDYERTDADGQFGLTP